MLFQNSATRKNYFKLTLCFLLLAGIVFLPFAGMGTTAKAAGGISISTAFPGVTVKAGENIDFSIKVLNDTDTPKNVGLTIKSAPEGWESYFEGNGNEVSRVYVEKNDYSNVTYNVKIPEDVKEGVYKAVLTADAGGGAADTLELEMKVSEKEMTQGKFTSQYPELQGSPTTTFKFTVDLANNSSKDQSYSLSAIAPEGWEVTFAPAYEDKQIASISLQAGKTQGINVTIRPPQKVKAGKYTIPCTAASAAETLKTELSVTITGTYSLESTTTTGVLSFDAYSGSETPVKLKITNTGSAELNNIELTSASNQEWTVRFDSKSIESLPAGATKEITAYIKPGANSIAGDYLVVINVGNQITSDQVELRMAVKTPTAWGIVGVVIILIVIAGLIWIFRKFGRR